MIESEEVNMPNPIEEGQKLVLRLENSEQKSTLYHPIRRKILEVLVSGIPDYQVKTDSKEELLADGTGITHFVSTRTPFQRYWMTVAEILAAIEVKFPKTKITKHRCYYHLQKLSDLGLVEQYPPASFDESGNKQRSRGMQFRTAARFFVSCLRDISPQISNQILDVIKKSWGVSTAADDDIRLKEILIAQDDAIVSAMEYLATNMKQPPEEYLNMPLVLEQLAWILLSDDENFVALHREAREILVSGGQILGSSNYDSVKRQNNE